MPANLTPEYLRLDERYRAAKDPQERLDLLREMLRAIPKHKGTDHMQGDLRRRISKLEEAIEQGRKRSGGRDLFHVAREGVGQVLLAGAPNCGKSSLLARLTKATPQIADYPHTTQMPLPGMVQFEDVQIQLVDVPPLSREYVESALFNAYRVCTMILLVADLTAPDPVDSALDCMAQLEERMIRVVPHFVEQSAGSVAMIEKQALILGNKLDLVGPEHASVAALGEAFGAEYDLSFGSALTGEGLEGLPEKLFRALRLVRVYTKKPGRKFERDQPFVLPAGSRVIDVAGAIHKDIAEGLRFVRLWGSGKHEGINASREHVVADGDVLEIHSGR
ncbi:MAG: 50S ribosome-binding GTPase [Candidatus Eisenbacteria bacterium]|uniref:50S ribosome-binding GTPase n=1 Tax=Eiseniibacteriota bacterium TaxID=2212470 RepID=A0A937XAQ0_UNCEI|nr:50S ribosome-binding GTPase [Candidatus Eisenbacteria bacterium]